MAVIRIEDAGDPRVADYRNIPDSVLLERRHAFVAEGRLVVRRLLTSNRFVTRSLMVTAPALAALHDHPGVRDVPVYLVSQAVMDQVSGFNVHRGCLAIGERPDALDWRAVAAGARRLVVLERVANADNVGAIFRNAAAFGVDAVLLGPACADPLYRRAIRTSMAATLTVPFARVEPAADPSGATPTPWPDAVRWLRGDFLVIGLSPSADAVDLAGLLRETWRLVPPARRDAGPSVQRVALLAGHEGDGLTPDALSACDHVARIPMAAGHDSLNVATAIAIALHQLFAIHDS